ncbi:hypothetical protein [Agrobacterium cavarae]|uniref:hypothetical protein n=1 Tax=Agrobacterium cavarae TaxID=2528239 RepID=UPI003D010560
MLQSYTVLETPMKRFAAGAAALFLLSTTTAVLAQTYEVSSIAPTKKASSNSAVAKKPKLAKRGKTAVAAKTDVAPKAEVAPRAESAATYIVDVSGKRVRLIGPRFYPDNSNELELAGRKDALMREAALMDTSISTASR